MASQTYTIYLLKDSFTSLDGVINSTKTTTRHNLSESIGFEATLFLGKQNRSIPTWAELVNPYLETSIQGIFQANISAVLLAKYEEQTLAVCFGYGKSLLTIASWVRDFGLRVTLNRVGHDQLRSLDTKVYEDTVLSARKQTSRIASIDSFDIDVGRSLLRGVNGKPIDTTYFKNLSGSDGLTLSTELLFGDIGDLFDELLVAYSDTSYQKHFKWVDNVKEVDPLVAARLDQNLLDAIKTGAHDGLHLAPTDILIGTDIQGFSFTGGGTSVYYPDLSFTDYLGIHGKDLASLSLSQFKGHVVRVKYDTMDESQDMWSVYECIVWETDIKGHRYVLFDGRWFEIDATYANDVFRYVKDISRDAATLPDGNYGDAESVYNQSVVHTNPNAFALFDLVKIRAEGAATPFELCDVLSDTGQFIHVKKRASSATLSHLFSQGTVSASAFMRDDKVRKQVTTHLQKMKKTNHLKLIPKSKPNATDYEVVYAILSKYGKQWPPRLPFFSAVNLLHHGRLVESQGFRVSLQHVKQL